ncbi:MAG: hypothetical protein Q4B77_00080 [Coriobacteriaceae bacterium]|nr:hypothetical protein [Coriobacteriaceae bacterium]
MDLRTVILYRSKHHGNTKKLIDAVVAAHPEIDLIDVATLGKYEYPDLSSYHIIGFASGIYYGGFDKDLRRVAQECLRDGDNVIGFMTYGGTDKQNGRDLDGICRVKRATLVSIYGCVGFDTWGPFKLVGGVNKDRPNQEDIDGAVEFYDRIVEDYGQIFIDERKKRDRRDAWDAAHPAGGLMMNIKRSAKKIAKKFEKPADDADEVDTSARTDSEEPTSVARK